MSLTIPHQSLVVVADGHQARYFRAHNVSGEFKLSEEKEQTPKNLSDEGPSGHRPEEQTHQQTDEATFAKQLAEQLYAMHHGGKFQDLVLAADPQTLGQVRGTLHKRVADAIVMSIDKELTGHSVAEIEKIIGKADK